MAIAIGLSSAAAACATALPNPSIIGGSSPFSGSYVASNIFDKNDGTEYASATQGVNTYLDFDFGSPKVIGTLEHQNRPSDVITSSQLILSQDATFGNFDDVVQTITHPAHVSASPLPNYFSFPAVTAQYARWDVTGVSGCCGNNGAKEMAFHSESWTRLANPTITAGANAHAGVAFNNNVNGFAASNVFDAGYDTAYSSAGLGVVSQPLTTSVTGGTWLEFDFGSTTSFDGFSFYNRGTPEALVTTRLIFSNDATFDANDSAVVLTHANQTTNEVFAFARQSGQYVRWEVTEKGVGAVQTLGARDMGFLQELSPDYRLALPDPTIYNASTGHPCCGVTNPTNILDENLATEYSSHSLGTGTFIDFDFGSVVKIAGFDHTQRPAASDNAWAANLIFSNNSDLSSPIATVRIDHNRGASAFTSTTFPAVYARYVRWDVIAIDGSSTLNIGGKEIDFFTAVPEPSSLAMLGFGMALMFFRKRGK